MFILIFTLICLVFLVLGLSLALWFQRDKSDIVTLDHLPRENMVILGYAEEEEEQELVIRDNESQVTLKPPVQQAGLEFGVSTALHGNYIAVGAPGFGQDTHNNASGIVYVFLRHSGRLFRTFMPRNPMPGQRFGHQVSLDGVKPVRLTITDAKGHRFYSELPRA